MEYILKYAAIPLAILLVMAVKAGAGRMRTYRAGALVGDAEGEESRAGTAALEQRPILSARGFPRNALIVNESRWLGLDAIYVLIIQPGLVVAACVGDQMILGQSLGLLSPENPLALARADRLIPALAVEPESDAFLALDKRNFRIVPAEVASIGYSARRALWTVGVKNSGTLRIAMSSGKRRDLILLGCQDLQALIGQLSDAGFPVEHP